MIENPRPDPPAAPAEDTEVNEIANNETAAGSAGVVFEERNYILQFLTVYYNLRDFLVFSRELFYTGSTN